jgi:hypothetical protein
MSMGLRAKQRYLAHGIIKGLSIFWVNGDLYECIELEPASIQIGVFKPWDYHLGWQRV